MKPTNINTDLDYELAKWERDNNLLLGVSAALMLVIGLIGVFVL